MHRVLEILECGFFFLIVILEFLWNFFIPIQMLGFSAEHYVKSFKQASSLSAMECATFKAYDNHIWSHNGFSKSNCHILCKNLNMFIPFSRIVFKAYELDVMIKGWANQLGCKFVEITSNRFEWNRYSIILKANILSWSTGCVVRIECRNRDTGRVTYTKEAVTDSKGEYTALVQSDRGEDFCDAVLVKSSDPECSSPNAGRDRARVILTNNNGMASTTRHANAMGFLANKPLPNCPQILQKYLETDEWHLCIRIW